MILFSQLSTIYVIQNFENGESRYGPNHRERRNHTCYISTSMQPELLEQSI